MTTETRGSLIERSGIIVEEADGALNHPRNVGKDDNWANYPIHVLMMKLDEEVWEVKQALHKAKEIYHQAFIDNTVEENVALNEAQADLVMESGDVLNLLRMICDNAGALNLETPEEIPYPFLLVDTRSQTLTIFCETEASVAVFNKPEDQGMNPKRTNVQVVTTDRDHGEQHVEVRMQFGNAAAAEQYRQKYLSHLRKFYGQAPR